jgi:hypothetical protein
MKRVTPAELHRGDAQPKTPEGFEGPIGPDEYRCLTCAAKVAGPHQYLEQHRQWHADTGR